MNARRIAGGGAIIIIAVGLIWLSIASGIARMTAARYPSLALGWMPWDARAQAEQAERLLIEAKDARSIARAQELAGDALKQDPTVVGAVRTIALSRQVGNRPASAERLIRYSTALSRRDLGTRLWLIERSVEKGDFRAALHHYDLALRTSRKAREILMPILANAIAERELIGPLAARLANKPQWRPDFIRFLIYEGRHTKESALLAQMLYKAGSPLEANETTALVSRLVNEGHFEQAGGLYRQFKNQPQAGIWQVQNGNFEGRNTDTPFDWQLTTAYGLSARVENKPSGDSALFYDQNIDEGGELAKQTLLLKPGKYNLRLSFGALDGFSPGRLRVHIACVKGAKQDLLRIEVLMRSLTGERRSDPFSVPGNCPVQNLIVEGIRQDVLNGGWVDDVAVIS